MKPHLKYRFSDHWLQNVLGHRNLSHQILGLILAGSALLSLAWMFMSLWNLTIVDIAGWPALNIWQTLGAMVLIRILSWLVGYPPRHASQGPLMSRGIGTLQETTPDV